MEEPQLSSALYEGSMKRSQMINSPFKCLFCLGENVSFTRVEHPIPESLGNDDWVLPKGFVCDGCNQYFGSKIENRVSSSPPFTLERMASNVRTKKGRLPYLPLQKGLRLIPSGFKDQLFVHADSGYVDYYYHRIGKEPLEIPWPKGHSYFLARFMLKLGLEMLLGTNFNPYSSHFDLARNHARRGVVTDGWQIGYAFYPRREDLIFSTRHDHIGPIVKHHLYEYSMGVLPGGDLSMCLIYGQHIFACNLSRSSILEHLMIFNRHNEMTMRFYQDPAEGVILAP